VTDLIGCLMQPSGKGQCSARTKNEIVLVPPAPCLAQMNEIFWYTKQVLPG